jgi:hypothetical protein
LFVYKAQVEQLILIYFLTFVLMFSNNDFQ